MSSPHLEVRNAFLKKRNGDTCYGLGEWRRYEQGAWLSVPELAIKKEIQFIAAKHPKLTVTASAVSSITELCRQCIAVSDLLFDSNPNVIIFADRVLDLTTWSTVPHSPDHYATSRLSFDYDPSANLSEWDRFLVSLP